jgi:hypothetical protein
MLSFVTVDPSASLQPGQMNGLGMYRAGANDKTWMDTMTQPYPSMTAPGRWDVTPVVGFVPPYYGPNVPGCYLDPYLYGTDEKPVDVVGLTLVGIAIAAGGFLGVWLAKRR